MTEQEFQEFSYWFNSEATEKEKELYEKYQDFSKYFSDMLFEPDSAVYPYISVMVKDNGSDEWGNGELDIPEEYLYLPNVRIYIKDIYDGFEGQYNRENKTITISSKNQDDDSALLHEMIHLLEHCFEDRLSYYRDAVFISLYQGLLDKVENLDDMILEHGHIINQDGFLNAHAGVHDILFFLKSLDIDLQKGYPLGTVFGYGYKLG